MTYREFFDGYDFNMNLEVVAGRFRIPGFTNCVRSALYFAIGATESTRLFERYAEDIDELFDEYHHTLANISRTNKLMGENMETYLRYYTPNVDYSRYVGRDLFDVDALKNRFKVSEPGAYLVFTLGKSKYAVHRIESDNVDSLNREIVALLKPERYFGCKGTDIPEVWRDDSFRRYIEPYVRSSNIAESGSSSSDGVADDNFYSESKKIVDEIKERIRMLEISGMTRDAIFKLVGLSEVPVSRIHIDRNYRFFLTDYNNREIVMEPLPKAVYLLFLCHPEGIRFKYLADYRSELQRIYNAVTGGKRLSSAIEDSINRVTDPCDNSINEKCSRARSAFIKEISQDIVDKYYSIKGYSGNPKRIDIDRNLVTWDKPV